MQFKVKALTPIWTGGVKGICDRLYETGILGSLRSWYEVIVRELGGYACDPTCGVDCPESSDGMRRCPVKVDHHTCWCNACDLFGMTGLRRKFRLGVTGGHQVYPQKSKRQHIGMQPRGRGTGWFQGAGIVDGTGQGDSIILSINPLSPQNQVLEEALEMLLFFVSNWAGIGSRQQHGYGVVDIRGSDDSPISPTEAKLKNLLSLASQDRPTLRREKMPTNLPSLKGCFFAKFRLENLPSGWEQSIDGRPGQNKDQIRRYEDWHKSHSSRIFAPSLKNQIRFSMFNGKKATQELLFGYARGKDKQAARVRVSHAYNTPQGFEVRVWGCLPEKTGLAALYNGLAQSGYWKTATGYQAAQAKLIAWRELEGDKAGRCTDCASGCHTADEFLKCLVLLK